MGCFVLELAVSIPFNNLENSSNFQKLHMFLHIMGLICRINKILKQAIVSSLHPVLMINHLYDLKEHASLLVKDLALIRIASQGAEDLAVDRFYSKFNSFLFIHIFACSLYTILKKTSKHLFIRFECLKNDCSLGQLILLTASPMILS